MLRQLLLSDIDVAKPEHEGWALLAAEFPTVAVQPLASGEGAQVLCLNVDEWLAPDFDPLCWDPRVFSAAKAERLALHLVGTREEVLAHAALEILTRYQGFIGRRNEASSGGMFDRILERHRALHDLGKPWIHADYRHALDAWQWLLRLEPRADMAMQVAALFHGVERLLSGADAHTEHDEEDSQLFKDANAALSSELTCALLEELKVDPAIRERVRWLVTHHEQPSEHSALALLNDADALSFFSFYSSCLARSFGFERTRHKIASTLVRLRPAQRARLARVRLAPLIRELIEEHLPSTGSASQEGLA